MKRTASISMVALAALLLLGTWGFAQMMGGTHTGSRMMMNDSAGSNGMNQENMSGMMKNMSGMCPMMSGEMSALKDHFDKMMAIDNYNDLKPEMVKHQQMMASLMNQMQEPSEMCRNMMSSMKGGAGQGVESSQSGGMMKCGMKGGMMNGGM